MATNGIDPKAALPVQGDLNNTSAARAVAERIIDPTYSYKSFAIEESEDDAGVRAQYRPFLQPDNSGAEEDWVAQLELSTAAKMVESEIVDKKLDRLRILVLYGSMRTRYVQKTTVFSPRRVAPVRES